MIIPHFRAAPASRQRLLERRQVAELLGLSVSSLEKWAEHGTGPQYYRRGLSSHAPTYYRIEDIEDFVRQRHGDGALATFGTR
jgi:predicted DNA-binding transcriptional regulator AlpA